MKRYETILLDADGTIFDFDKAETFALENAFRELSFPYDEHILKVYKKINADLWHLLEKGKTTQSYLRDKRFELLHERFDFTGNPSLTCDAFIKYLSRGVFFLDGAVDILEYLHDKYPLYLVTNGITEVQESRYVLSGLDKYFKEMYISESLGVSKPNVEYFNKVFDAIGAEKIDDILIIGDSLTSDIRGGINAGIDTCWYNQFGRQNDTGITPTYEISALSELKHIL